jgi:hypothetical protein
LFPFHDGLGGGEESFGRPATGKAPLRNLAMLPQRARSSLTVKCPLCGQAGFIVWEDGGDGKARQLIHVSRGFHPEIGRTRSGEPLIVCNACDHIQKA